MCTFYKFLKHDQLEEKTTKSKETPVKKRSYIFVRDEQDALVAKYFL